MARTILLADDSMTIQKVVELTFMDEDYQVVTVSDGNAAIQKLSEMQPDLLITDVHMPGANGYDVCRHAKAAHSHMPVLLLVGTFEQFDENEANSCGSDGFLKKPFDSQELLSRVETLVSQAPAAAPEAASPAPAPVVVPSAAPQEERVPEMPSQAPTAPPAPSFEAPASLFADPAVDSSPVLPMPGAPQPTAPTFAALEPAAPEPAAPKPAAPEPASAPESLAPPMEAAQTRPMPMQTAPDDGRAENDGVVDRNEAAESNGSSDSAGLSDHDVDRIARRMVELIGDKALKEIAWEVLPDLAEVVVRERIHELEHQVEST